MTPVVERSNDGGDTWVDITPLYTGIAQVASLEGIAVDAVEAIAAIGPACETRALRSFTNGRFWESYPEVLSGSRFIDLTTSSTVHLGGISVPAPCVEARGLRAVRSVAAVICGDVAFVRSEESWTPLSAVAAVAVAVDGADVIVGHVDERCEGLALTRYLVSDVEQPSSPAGCAEGVDTRQPVAITFEVRGTLVWSNDAIAVVPSP
ncbi:hypothetical protein GCM10017690_08400 [Microbacterium terregens]